MIVFGDSQRTTTLSAQSERVRARAEAIDIRVADDLDEGDARERVRQVDRARRLLIEAGGLEQAVHDHLVEAAHPHRDELVTAVQLITDTAAELFCATWDGSSHRRDLGSPSGCIPRIAHLLDGLGDQLHDPSITARTPEGFSFYSLYPEQYCAAAQRWAADHASAIDRRALVVGLRSIGTSLSAVVATTLAAAGWAAQRVTVRPAGEHTKREVELAGHVVGDVPFALVVDEGPGLSGSSMTATAEALERAGVVSSGISFLPGHAGEPGSSATELVRRRWAATPRYVIALDALRWNGRSLPELLGALSAAASGSDAEVDRVEAIGGGGWRQVVYDDPDDWPAVCAPFERTKYRCLLSNGRAVLWKFAGADDEVTAAELTARSQRGWGRPPLAIANGFVATTWLPGRPLTIVEGGAGVLDHVAAYVSAIAGPPLTASEASHAFARLAEMLYWNTWEGLDADRAEGTTSLAALAQQQVPITAQPTYGDGRVGPGDWLRDTGSGRLHKVGGVGHQRDHTMVGRQPLVWDVAGAIVEWQLCGERRASLVRRVEAEHPYVTGGPAYLDFHVLAYAAFRLGQITMSAAMTDDAADRQRLHQAQSDARAQLTELLDAVR